MRLIRVLVLVAGAMVSMPSSRSEEPIALEPVLTALTAGAVKEPLTIEYELVGTTSPFKGPKEELERQVAEVRKHYAEVKKSVPPEAAKQFDEAGERMAEAVRQSLEQGSRTVTRGTLVLASEFSALKASQTNQKEQSHSFWEVRKGDLYFSLDEQNAVVTVLDKKIHKRSDKIEQALRAIGLLGKLPEEIARKALSNPQVTKNGSTLRIVAGPEEVVRETQPDGSFLVKSFGHRYEKVGQSGSTSFGEYRTFGEWRIPAVIQEELSTNRYDLSWRYSVVNLRPNFDDLQIPFVNTALGTVNVHDSRFSPAVSYWTDSELASDEQIKEWMADPKALEEHNRKIRNPKRGWVMPLRYPELRFRR